MTTECLKCGFFSLDPTALTCSNCGAVYAKLRALAADGKSIRAIKSPEQIQRESALREKEAAEHEERGRQRIADAVLTARRTGDWSVVPKDVIDQGRRAIVMTTTENVPSARVEEIIEIVAAECVYGMNIFKDMMVDVRDIVGGRSTSAQRVLKDARVTALNELRSQAFAIGADAVISIRVDYNDLSGGNRMLFVAATGTAVRLAKAR